MLITKKVDAVVCVGASGAKDQLFEYQFIQDPADLDRCKKSRYYPVEVSSVIPLIKASEGKVLFIGLPCFIKALRLAMDVDPVLKKRIAYTVGLVCGHLKTKKYAAYLARNCGVLEENIHSVDFRRKIEGRSAHKYAFSVEERTEAGLLRKQVMMDQVWASSWGNNLFMLKACESCDDIFAETADIVVGDGWLNEFAADYRGTSVILCRTEAMRDLLKEGVELGELCINDLGIDRVIESQVGALRQRRDGLEYRLAVAKQEGSWRPVKRVAPNLRAGKFLFRVTQKIRLRMARISKEAFMEQEQSGEGLEIFQRRLKYLLIASKVVNIPRHFPGYCKKAFQIVTGRK
jgi:coenzyme F420-reducing hydrogenase beta subunit